MGHRSSDHHSRRGHGGRRNRHRARRGALRAAILTLLGERPMHGYELMSELESRSGGRWRPSPGAVYPALDRMENDGLVTATEDDGKRSFVLTDDGHRALAELHRDRGDDAAAPWEDPGTGHRGDLRRQVSELVSQARQIGRFGDADQIERASVVFADATRKLYEVLATPANTAADGDRRGRSTDRAGDGDPAGASDGGVSDGDSDGASDPERASGPDGTS